VHDELFDPEKFRNEYLYYKHMSLSVGPSLDDEIYRDYFSHASTSGSRINSDEEDLNFLSFSSEAWDDEVQSEIYSSSHVLFGSTTFLRYFLPPREMVGRVDDLLLVNPEGCSCLSAKNLEHDGYPEFLSSPPCLLISPFLFDSAAKPDRVEDIPWPQLIANLKGIIKIREVIVEQFVEAVRRQSHYIVIGAFGCSKCGLHMEQVAGIYKEAAEMFSDKGIVKVYVACPNLWAALNHLHNKNRIIRK